MAAAANALALPELLEDIIMHLPLRQMLLVQRVCTTFRDVIWRSSKINRALFFIPATEGTIEWHKRTDEGFPNDTRPYSGNWKASEDGKPLLPILNPFISCTKISFKEGQRSSRMPVGRDWHNGISDGIAERYLRQGECLLFTEGCRRFLCDFWDDTCTKGMRDAFGDANLHLVEEAINERRANLLDGSVGCFKEMLVTHPPCRNIRILRDARLWLPSYRGGIDENEIDEDDGICFQDFIDATGRMTATSSTDLNWNPGDYEFQNSETTVEVVGGELWRKCPKSIDDMTGWEMLVIFDADTQTLELG